jgi:hypothetical protein
MVSVLGVSVRRKQIQATSIVTVYFTAWLLLSIGFKKYWLSSPVTQKVNSPYISPPKILHDSELFQVHSKTFLPPFIIKSVHYKTISTTYVVNSKILHYLVNVLLSNIPMNTVKLIFYLQDNNCFWSCMQHVTVATWTVDCVGDSNNNNNNNNNGGICLTNETKSFLQVTI